MYWIKILFISLKSPQFHRLWPAVGFVLCDRASESRHQLANAVQRHQNVPLAAMQSHQCNDPERRALEWEKAEENDGKPLHSSTNVLQLEAIVVLLVLLLDLVSLALA